MSIKSLVKREKNFDVVVVGGGVAGFTAAVASARLGAKTALIEDEGALGGILTTGGNPEIGIFFAYYKQVISGIGWELCERLQKKGYADIPDFSSVDTRDGCSKSNVKVNRAMTEVEMNNMCLEAGVDLFFHTKAIDVVVENNIVKYVIAAEKCGLIAFSANVFIDCTGDGDIAYLSGAEQFAPKEVQPGTFGYSFECKDISKLDEKTLRNDFEKRKSDGLIKFGDFWPEFHSTLRGFLTSGGQNVNHIVMDGASADGISQAEIDGRNSMARMLEFAKSVTEIKIFPPASYVAPRETRRTICDYVVTVNDFITGRIFPDSLSYAYYNMDLHSSSKEVEKSKRPFELDSESEKVPDGIVPTIPYSAMTVKGLKNLLTAGRCISTEREVMGAFRVKASCMGMGQAVGVAAAFTENNDVRKVEIEKIKDYLRKTGAIVPDENLFKPKNK